MIWWREDGQAARTQALSRLDTGRSDRPGLHKDDPLDSGCIRRRSHTLIGMRLSSGCSLVSRAGWLHFPAGFQRQRGFTCFAKAPGLRRSNRDCTTQVV